MLIKLVDKSGNIYLFNEDKIDSIYPAQEYYTDNTQSWEVFVMLDGGGRTILESGTLEKANEIISKLEYI